MGNAAVLLKKLGHEVAGSDAGVYPPMSDVLTEAGIDLFEVAPLHITPSLDPLVSGFWVFIQI